MRVLGKRLRVLRGERRRARILLDRVVPDPLRRRALLRAATHHRSQHLPWWSDPKWLAFFLNFVPEPRSVLIPIDVYRAHLLHHANGAEHTRKNAPLFLKSTFPEVFRGTGLEGHIVRNLSGFDETAALLDSGGVVVTKRVRGVKGEGLRVWTREDGLDELKGILAGGTCVAQERLEQHSRLDLLNPHSRNTLRIVTVRLGGALRCLFRLGRIGTGPGLQDNTGQGGIAVGLDETGGCIGAGVDREFRTHTVSPSTGHALSGWAWPGVPRATETCLELHAHMPAYRIVGWDVLIGPTGAPTVLEANSDPSLILAQVLLGPVFPGRHYDEIADALS